MEVRAARYVHTGVLLEKRSTSTISAACRLLFVRVVTDTCWSIGAEAAFGLARPLSADSRVTLKLRLFQRETCALYCWRCHLFLDAYRINPKFEQPWGALAGGMSTRCKEKKTRVKQPACLTLCAEEPAKLELLPGDLDRHYFRPNEARPCPLGRSHRVGATIQRIQARETAGYARQRQSLESTAVNLVRPPLPAM